MIYFFTFANNKIEIPLKTTKILIVLFAAILLSTSNQITAQNWSRGGKLSHEIGFVVGSAHFATDYGERYDTESAFTGNVGLGIGFVHYLTLVDYRYRWNQRTSWFREHFRFRNEISYFSSTLEHAGEYVDTDRNTIGVQKLKAMSGEAKNINIGTQMEYHLLNITDFGSRRNKKMIFSPYVSAGVMLVHTSPSLFTTFGDGNWEEDRSLLFNKWAQESAVDVDGGFTLSITGSAGSRIRLSDYSDIHIEAKWQYFADDSSVDGLDAHDYLSDDGTNIIEANNKFNDWTIFLNVGYAFYLN